MKKKVRITECPRDAMQGIRQIIPTELKAEYLNLLLESGFYRLDFGSFVSPKAIPQMADTAKLLGLLNLEKTHTELLAIIANVRGAEEAGKFGQITYLGFPFSISETFQKRNTNSSISESLLRVEKIQKICLDNDKKLQIYISMAFGNPYGDEWNEEIVFGWCRKLAGMGIGHIALADTTGSSDEEGIKKLFTAVIPELKDVKFSAHLHSTKEKAYAKILAAVESGCYDFDTAMRGYGGCPMAADDLTGNIATEELLKFADNHGLETGLDRVATNEAYLFSQKIFANYH